MISDRGMDWSANAPTDVMPSFTQGDSNFSATNGSVVISSCNPGDILVSDLEPSILFQEIGYSPEFAGYTQAFFDTARELVSPKSMVPSDSSDVRVKLQSQVVQKRFSENNSSARFDVPCSNTHIPRPTYESVEARTGINHKENNENLNTSESVGRPELTLQSIACSSNDSATANFSRLQLSSNSRIDVLGLCSTSWDDPFSLLVESPSDNPFKLARKAAFNSHGETDSNSRKNIGSSKKHNQAQLLGNHFGKHTNLLEKISISLNNGKLKTPIKKIETLKDSDSTYNSGIFSLGLPKISQTLTSSPCLETRAMAVSKRRLSFEEENETLISCCMNKFDHAEFRKYRKVYPLEPMVIPSIPVIPDLNAIKINLSTLDRRTKTYAKRKPKSAQSMRQVPWASRENQNDTNRT